MKKVYITFILIVGLIMTACSSTGTRNFESSRNDSGADRMSYFREYGYPSPNERSSKKIPYLMATSHMNGKRKFLNRETESKILKFYKDLDIRGFGDNSYYWRWYFSIDKNTLERNLNRTVYENYKRRHSSVLTLSNGKWIKKYVPVNPVGKLKKVVVLERGKSGVVTYLLVSGTKGDYLIKGEYGVRIALGLRTVNVNRTVKVYRAKGGSLTYSSRAALTNPRLLPSGYLAIERRGNEYYIYGGGYGHGVGLVQYGAYDLGENYGYDYKKILRCYYSDVAIKNMYRMSKTSKYIRVGITTTGHSSLEHKTITLTSHGRATLTNGWMNMKLSPRDKVKIVCNGNKKIIYVNGKKRAETIQGVKYTPKNNKIIVTSIKRAHRNTMFPVYRGVMEIKNSPSVSGRMRMINELKMEEYLMQVLPSEMPKSFGLEALKAQAVAARTYALNDYFHSRFKKYGFDVIDDTRSQMYNNEDENNVSTRAIKETYGKVMLYNGKPIQAKYYSTSSGYGASAHNVW